MTLSVHRRPFTVRLPFTVLPDEWLMDNGKCMENGKPKMENESTERSVL